MPLKFGIIEQTVHFEASPADVFDALLNSGIHTEFTGSPATTSRRTGARFTAWDGYISGKNIQLVKNAKIVQEWKTAEWPQGTRLRELNSHLARRMVKLNSKWSTQEFRPNKSKTTAKVRLSQRVRRTARRAKRRQIPVISNGQVHDKAELWRRDERVSDYIRFPRGTHQTYRLHALLHGKRRAERIPGTPQNCRMPRGRSWTQNHFSTTFQLRSRKYDHTRNPGRMPGEESKTPYQSILVRKAPCLRQGPIG